MERGELLLLGCGDTLPGVAAWTCPDLGTHRLQRQPRVPHQGGIRLVAGTDDARVQVQVHDARRTGCRMAPSLGGDGACAATDEDHGVGRIHQCAGGRGATVTAHHPDGQGVQFRDRALAADRRGHGGIQFLGQLGQSLLRPRDDHAAAAHEQRAARGLQGGRHRVHGAWIRCLTPGRVVPEVGVSPHAAHLHRGTLYVQR